jgi:hypothetical protein
MKLTRYEKETIINYNEEEETASVYTHNNKLREKLLRLAVKYPDKIMVENKGRGVASFIVPKRCISVREPYSDARDRPTAKERIAQIKPPSRGKRSKSE